MTRAQFDEMVARRMTESVWEEHIQRALEAAGFDLHYHTLRSKGSDPGFPDDVAIHDRTMRMVWIEAKRQTGKLSHKQVVWLDRLVRLKPVFPIEVYAPVRPLDSDALWLSLSEAASESKGGLHQWCLDQVCGKCGPERASATGLPPVLPGSSTRRNQTRRSSSLKGSLPSKLNDSLRSAL